MANWQHRIRIRRLFTKKEDHKSVQESMNAIADVLAADSWFDMFRAQKKFRSIPKGDDTFGPVDYSNKLLSALYDFCDEQLIWIEF